MSKEIRLHYPNRARPVMGRCFVAFGTARGVGDVKAVLRDAKKRVVAEGRTLQKPPHWIVYFSGVDVLPGEYLLEVNEVGVTIPLSATHRVALAGPAGKGIQVDFPPDGEVFGPEQLVAYGTTDQNLRVTGRLTVRTPSGPVERTAEQIHGPPETPHWVITFADLPAGEAVLEVSNTSGKTAVRGNLFVQAEG
jgi:hypothetical protein